MISTLNSILVYLKNPICSPLEDLPTTDKLKIVGKVLMLSIAVSFFLAIIIGVLSQAGVFDIDEHASNKLFEEYSPFVVIFLVTIAAPILEELIFRAPITLFRKNVKQFKYVFYAFALVFGFVHITNYELTPSVLLFSPILVSPQICLGLFLGYLRVRLGLIYSILLHMSFNAFLSVPSLLFA